jgi:hypothetical protein
MWSSQGVSSWFDDESVRQVNLLDLERELEKGTINFGCATAESSQTERDAAVAGLKEVLDDRPVISIDFGIKNEITLVCTCSWAKPDGNIRTSASRYIMSTMTRFDGTGLDRYLEIKMEESGEASYQ